MKRIIKLMIIPLLIVFLCIGNAAALSLGQNITISDQNIGTNPWSSDREDNEVEPGMVQDQIWDLEGFFLNGSILTMVGGYDFKNGVLAGSRNWDSGDLFLDVTNDAVFGDIHGSELGNRDVLNSFGYDYAFDFDMNSETFNLYAINANSHVLTSYYKQNQGSNPWRYESGGQFLSSGAINLGTITEAELVGKDLLGGDITDGGIHYTLSLDLGQLADKDFIAHYTMECGNDNLMGQSVPEPSTFLLIFTGLFAMFALRKLITFQPARH